MRTGGHADGWELWEWMGADGSGWEWMGMDGRDGNDGRGWEKWELWEGMEGKRSEILSILLQGAK